MKNGKYSLYLNKVRINLAANLGRSPLIKEPLSKSYGVSASPEACRCKAQREANGLKSLARAATRQMHASGLALRGFQRNPDSASLLRLLLVRLLGRLQHACEIAP